MAYFSPSLGFFLCLLVCFCHRRPDSSPYSIKRVPTHLSALILCPLPARHLGLAVPLGWPCLRPKTYCSHCLEYSPSQTFRRLVYIYHSELCSTIISSEVFPNSPHKKLTHLIFFVSLIIGGNRLLLLYVIVYCSVSLSKIKAPKRWTWLTYSTFYTST